MAFVAIFLFLKPNSSPHQATPWVWEEMLKIITWIKGFICDLMSINRGHKSRKHVSLIYAWICLIHFVAYIKVILFYCNHIEIITIFLQYCSINIIICSPSISSISFIFLFIIISFRLLLVYKFRQVSHTVFILFIVPRKDTTNISVKN